MIYPKHTAANRNRIFENCPFVLPTEFLGPVFVGPVFVGPISSGSSSLAVALVGRAKHICLKLSKNGSINCLVSGELLKAVR